MSRNPWNVDWIVSAVKGKLIAAPAGYGELEFRNISTDTRNIGSGELFVALKGPNYDAHNFIGTAVQAGATGMIVRKGFAASADITQNQVVIEVPDTLTALGDLAAAHRKRFGIPVAAITGSTGKTTTKEMLKSIFLAHFGDSVLATEGNFNNLIGLPLTLFRLTDRHKVAVLEMGMSMRGEIHRLTDIAAPDIGVMTNVSEVHMEQLTSIAAIAQAKGELLDRLGAEKSAVLNADDPRVAAMGENRPFVVKTFGIKNPADARASDIRIRGFEGITFTMQLGGESAEVSLSCVGRHNVLNALAAAQCAHMMGIPTATIVRGLESFRPAAMRCRILDILRVKVLDDTYNANPKSMDAALATLSDLAAGGRRIVVVGDMKELGGQSAAAHRRLGRHIAKTGADFLFVIGEFAGEVVAGALEEKMPSNRIIDSESHAEIVEILRDLAERGDVVLVKGSRSMRMELIVKGLKGESL